jgi:hypothetical protein
MIPIGVREDTGVGTRGVILRSASWGLVGAQTTKMRAPNGNSGASEASCICVPLPSISVTKLIIDQDSRNVENRLCRSVV